MRSCTAGTRAEKLKSGVYFVLLDVEQPLGTQIQLFGAIDVDPATGAFVAQFTNGDRNPDGTRCPTHCKDIDRCRLLPAPECVAPSLRAGTVDEYSDFVPNVEPPTGYSFPVEGCAVDDGDRLRRHHRAGHDGGAEPARHRRGLTMTAFFGPDAKGTVRATGSLTADTVLLGGNVDGYGAGQRHHDGDVHPGRAGPARRPATGEAERRRRRHERRHRCWTLELRSCATRGGDALCRDRQGDDDRSAHIASALGVSPVASTTHTGLSTGSIVAMSELSSARSLRTAVA